jgi:4-hydroxythreonine-4-phosphate dehydrogenase
VASKAGGTSALANYRHALRMAADGKADAVCFTPFNKQAMRMAEPTYDDEILFTSNVLGFKGLATEFNVLENLWNARVTSHIPLAEVSANLSVERIVAGLEITAHALRAAGFNPPRIGVAALNPHAGDGGNFGREEIDIIEPAVKKAKAKGLPADGPIRPTRCSCAPRPASSTRCSPCSTTRARSR